MQGSNINQSSSTPTPDGKFTEFGKSLCGCCSSKGNKSKSNELTKPGTITVQPSFSNIKRDAFIDGECMVIKNKVDANTVMNDNKSQKNGNISPHTSKRLKEDCSNVTTLALNDLIGTSNGTAQIDHISTSESSVYNTSVKELLKNSKRTENLDGEKDCSNLYEDSNETTNSTKCAYRRAHEPNYSCPLNSIYGNGSLELDDENEDEMDDITDILHETSSSNVNVTNASVNSHPQKPPRLTTQPASIIQDTNDNAIAVCATSDFIASTQNTDETLQQYIPSAAVQQATPSGAEHLRFTYDNQALNNHASADNQLCDDTDRQNIETSETSNIGGLNFNDSESKQFDMKKMNDGEIVEKIDAKVSTNQEENKPSKRPTRMYASSSSSNDEEDDDDNVTRISVKSQGDATVKSTTLNGEIVCVQLAPYSEKFCRIGDVKATRADDRIG